MRISDNFYYLTCTMSVGYDMNSDVSKGKGKAVPLQAQEGGKVVSLTHRPPLSTGNTPCILSY